MKATKLQKRKTAEASQGNTSCNKKPTSRTGGRCNRKTGKNVSSSTKDDSAAFSVTATQVVNQRLLKEDILSRDTEKKQEVVPNARLPLEKLKLQLFPIDEGTRIGLEKDGHNPYLELTLRARKKISSVLKHLNSKWGSSSVAVGDVTLFPYNIQLENRSANKKWSINDDHSCAGDVYADIGSPVLFRLRYGWLSNLDSRIFKELSETTLLGVPFESQSLQKSCGRIPFMDENRQLEGSREFIKPNDSSKTANAAADMPVNVVLGSMEDEDKKKSLTHPGMPWEDSFSNLSFSWLLSDVSLLGKINNCDSKSKETKSNSQPIQLFSSDISIGGLLSEASMQGKFVDNEVKLSGVKPKPQPISDNNNNNGCFPLPVLWDDSFTTLSIGGLFSEVSLQAKTDIQNKQKMQPPQLISGSLDKFNGNRLNPQTQNSNLSTQVSHSSILDAEETCHAFSFGKASSHGNSNALLIGSASLNNRNNIFELNNQSEFGQHYSRQESKTGQLAHPSAYRNENSLGLGGITWTESLGPFGISSPSGGRLRPKTV